MTTQLRIDGKRAQQIIAKRAIVKPNQIGETLRFHVQGNGFTMPMKNKSGEQVMDSNNLPLHKTIYNVSANSGIAMVNDRNRGILAEAFKAESTGDVDTAHDKFNEFLNKIQVTFNIVENNGRVNPKFSDKQLIEAEVALITTENGQLITLENVRAVRVEKAQKTGEFNLIDLLSLGETNTPKAEDVFTPVDEAAKAAEAMLATAGTETEATDEAAK